MPVLLRSGPYALGPWLGNTRYRMRVAVAVKVSCSRPLHSFRSSSVPHSQRRSCAVLSSPAPGLLALSLHAHATPARCPRLIAYIRLSPLADVSEVFCYLALFFVTICRVSYRISLSGLLRAQNIHRDVESTPRHGESLGFELRKITLAVPATRAASSVERNESTALAASTHVDACSEAAMLSHLPRAKSVAFTIPSKRGIWRGPLRTDANCTATHKVLMRPWVRTRRIPRARFCDISECPRRP